MPTQGARSPGRDRSKKTPGDARRRSGQPRGARRKRETRERLLRAAFDLIADRGADAVAINEITEAADVGFGSFYYHFESKEAVHATVLRLVFEGFGDALDAVTVDLDDPADKVATCVRLAIATARQHPRWGQLLLREWYRPGAFPLGLGPRLLRDVVAGVAAGRFKVTDPLMALVVAGGIAVAGIALQIAAPGEGAQLIAEAGLNGLDIDQRTAMTLLQALGVKDADRIAVRKLPTLAWSPEAACGNRPSPDVGLRSR